MLGPILIFALITIICVSSFVVNDCREPMKPIIYTEMTQERGRDGNLHNILKMKNYN